MHLYLSKMVNLTLNPPYSYHSGPMKMGSSYLCRVRRHRRARRGGGIHHRLWASRSVCKCKVWKRYEVWRSLVFFNFLHQKLSFTFDKQNSYSSDNERYLIAAGKCGRAELFARESGVDKGKRLWSVAFDSELNDEDAARPKAGAWIKVNMLVCGAS